MKKTEEMKTPQEEYEDNLHFLQRVDAYQYRRGLKRAAACADIGISEGWLSEIRNGKRAISAKAWRKLEAAEQRAGISGSQPVSTEPPPTAQPQSQPQPVQSQADIMAQLARDLYALRQAQAETLRQLQEMQRDHREVIDTLSRENAALRAKLDQPPRDPSA